MIADHPGSKRGSVHTSVRAGLGTVVEALRYTARPSHSPPMSTRHLYKVMFVSQGKIYEIYARSVTQGTLFGFIEVERLVFGERSTVVVDPAEERIKTEFAGVRRTYLPMHAVLRIDEVEKQGVSKVTAVEAGNVTPFPMPIYTPGGPGDSGK